MAVNENNLNKIDPVPGQRVLINGDKAFPCGPVIVENFSDIAGDLVVDFNDEYIGDDENGCTQYRWYRLYKSGWVEQGGRYYGGSADNPGWALIQLPITMADTSFCVFKTVRTKSRRSATLEDVAVGISSVNAIRIYCPSDDVSWCVYGRSAAAGE